MNHLEIRKLFKSFFTQNNHEWVSSASLVPHNDPSLLFINAGMNPFKEIFLNTQPAPADNLASIQKCVRAGGKHNDLKEVGFSPDHHTFFEMMGNFSFGGYSKEKACALSWSFLTEKLNIPKENLGISVFKKDTETAQIWKKLGIPDKKIFLFGEEDNFWRMGEEGPCGPCTEIYFDPQGFRSKNPKMFEVWNLVFMEYYEDKNKKQTPLKKKCIDTGMGLERITRLLQNQSSNFHTDLFRPILDQASTLINTSYHYIPPEEETDKIRQTNLALRILADHVRASCFLIADGVYPANTGRGYVLRRILRRAIYHSHSLTQTSSILSQVAQTIISQYSPIYPELKQNQQVINDFLNQEEEKFLNTLNQGKILLEKELHLLKKKKSSTLSGNICFKLYDTYGFPFDLVELICKKQNIKTDASGFQKIMKESQEKNRTSSQFKQAQGSIYNENTPFQKGFDPEKEGLFFVPTSIPTSQFIGYEKLSSSSRLLALFDSNNKNVETLSHGSAWAVFDQTPFYAEGGGQVGDQGHIANEKPLATIMDCKNMQGYYFHKIKVQSTLKVGQQYQLQVSPTHRKQTAIHHSATHLLHAALRKILGSQTKQAGSLVTANRLRFDFTCPNRLSEKQCSEIEELVNTQITQALPVVIENKSYHQAIKDGALSFFDKPSEKVRVLKMGDFSQELCGGTHVQNTSEIRYFKIISESSIGSGIRRIEALCGDVALKFLSYLSDENLKIRQAFSIPLPDMSSPSMDLLKQMENQLDQIKKLKKSKTTQQAPSLSVEKFTFNSQEGAFYCHLHQSDNHEGLSAIVDHIKKTYPLYIAVVTGKAQDKTPIVVALSSVISKKISPRDIILKLGGQGGGPALFAKGALTSTFSSKELRQQVLKILHDHNIKLNLLS